MRINSGNFYVLLYNGIIFFWEDRVNELTQTVIDGLDQRLEKLKTAAEEHTKEGSTDAILSGLKEYTDAIFSHVKSEPEKADDVETKVADLEKKLVASYETLLKEHADDTQIVLRLFKKLLYFVLWFFGEYAPNNVTLRIQLLNTLYGHQYDLQEFVVTATIRALEEERDRLKAELAQALATIASLEEALKKAKEQIAQLEGELQAAKEQIAKLQTELAEAKATIKAKESELAEALSSLTKTEKSLSASKSKHAKTQETLETCQADLVKAREQVLSLESSLKESQEALAKKDAALLKTKTSLDEQTARLGEAQEACSEKDEKIAFLEKQSAQLGSDSQDTPTKD